MTDWSILAHGFLALAISAASTRNRVLLKKMDSGTTLMERHDLTQQRLEEMLPVHVGPEKNISDAAVREWNAYALAEKALAIIT